ncbi:hypothetical protein C8R44DRAFT_754894 [Mycena epipterygia]|nr:hypothetical protein C8R44DRAFT_754894 [Mycena epipterygia]
MDVSRGGVDENAQQGCAPDSWCSRGAEGFMGVVVRGSIGRAAGSSYHPVLGGVEDATGFREKFWVTSSAVILEDASLGLGELIQPPIDSSDSDSSCAQLNPGGAVRYDPNATIAEVEPKIRVCFAIGFCEAAAQAMGAAGKETVDDGGSAEEKRDSVADEDTQRNWCLSGEKGAKKGAMR